MGMQVSKSTKPAKKSDAMLFDLLVKKIKKWSYVFLKHAKKRLKDRNINDLSVLDILENKPGRRRKRNKSKDKYEVGHQDWNYCIEGYNLDNLKIRIIVSFIDDLMAIITMIRLDD